MTQQAGTSRSEIGRTGVAIPEIAFGTSSLGHAPEIYGYGVDESEAWATIEAILDSPYPFLDTSRNYGDGRSETRIGHVLRERNGLPNDAVLSTKLDRDPESHKFDARRARESLEESLEALGLDSVQILHLHDPEYVITLEDVTRQDGAIDELFRMKEEGLTACVGLAAGTVDIMLPMLRNWDFDVVITHNRYMLTNRNAEPLLELATSRGITVMNAAPYAGGMLAKGSEAQPRHAYTDADAATLDRVRRIEAACRAHEVPLGAAALQFSMRDKRIAATICGITKPERIEQTVAWAEWPIPDAVWDALAEIEPSREDPQAGGAAHET